MGFRLRCLTWSNFLPSKERSLLDLVTVVGGGTPSRSEPRYWGGDIPWATVKDLTSTSIRDTSERITLEGLENSAATLIPAGAIVLATRIVPGRVALAMGEIAINQDLKGLVPREDVSSAYLLHFMRSIGPRIAGMGVGSTVKGVTLDTLSRVRVPLPTIAEQHRISGMLDTADAVFRKCKASSLLLEEFLRSSFLEMFGDPLRNEKRWDTVTLQEIASFVGGGTPSRVVPEFFTGSIPWASSKDMNGEDLFDTQEHVTAEAIERSATRVVPAGSILVVVKSKILLHRLPVAIARSSVCFSQDLKAITLHNSTVPATYLARHLRVGQQQLLKKARGANTEGLTLEHLRNYQLMLPPTALLERWNRIETTTRTLRGSLATKLEKATALVGSLSQEFLFRTNIECTRAN